MHELALSEQIVNAALNACGGDGRRIREIAVDVGALSAVSMSSLEFCLQVMLEQHGMEGTKARLTLVPARVRCDCGNTYEADDMFSPCPVCGGFMREIVDGKDVTIQYVEVDDEQEDQRGQVPAGEQ